MVSAAALIPANHAYYNYAGSLTTPPCTQGINCFVLKQPVSADSAQLAQIRAISDDRASGPAA